jgi:hypothetical protein
METQPCTTLNRDSFLSDFFQYVSNFVIIPGGQRKNAEKFRAFGTYRWEVRWLQGFRGEGKLKVKFTLEQTTKARKGSRSIALLFI